MNGFTFGSPAICNSRANLRRLSSPVVVNDVVLVATSPPALYAFSSANGVPLWQAQGIPQTPQYTYSLGPAVYGNFVVVGAGQDVLVYRL